MEGHGVGRLTPLASSGDLIASFTATGVLVCKLCVGRFRSGQSSNSCLYAARSSLSCCVISLATSCIRRTMPLR